MTASGVPGVRLAELVASLSLATDLGLGQPQEHVLRQTVIAHRLAGLAGLSESKQAAVFYVSLLTWVGCIADSHELAGWFGDDNQLRADSYLLDKTGLPMLRFLLGHVAAGGPPLRRVTMLGRFAAGGGFSDAMNSFVAHCQTTADIADRLDLDPSVRDALPQAFARWDGKGVPAGLGKTAIDPVMRIVHIADDAEVFHRAGGVADAVAMLRSRAGTEFDPELVALCCDSADEVFGDLDSVDVWATVISGCAPLDRRLDESNLTGVLEIFADYADLKSPWWLGHSRAVAARAVAAADRFALSADDTVLLERAALVHRLGAVGVSSSVWDKPGELSFAEKERVRTVPYLTERVLCRHPRLAAISSVAAMCHERLDGSGYPRGLTAAAIPAPARLLAAADMYQALGEDRPYRTAVPAEERAALMQSEVSSGRLDDRAVRAVLVTAGHRVRRRRELVAGLTEREAQVLALLARGWPNGRIAAELSISRRTVGSHVEHIYTKIGASTRGAAAMFAMRHGLVD
ncbi:MAG TPA: HD domain-containing phosphohydrolase [Jatrophihabitantaceae bacterium]|jgi:HD-GYP domain-containing protein (c-di-GMP phosphodiesterase class II)